MALATTLSPIAKAASKKTASSASTHAAPRKHPCHCDMSPYQGGPKHGSWANTALPGDKSTITNARRVKNPFTGGAYFAIDAETPMLSGNGDGAVRGWVLGTIEAAVKAKKGKKAKKAKSFRHQVQIDWGQQKKMPPPNLGGKPSGSTKPILYYYAFSVVINKTPHPLPKAESADDDTTPPVDPLPLAKPKYPAKGQPIHGVGASGWIPASCLVFKSAAKEKKLKPLLECAGECMARFDKQTKRKRFFHPRPAHATHRICSTSEAVAKKLSHRYYTKVHQGNASHYVSRSPDKVSPKGYVNVCYNLPDLTENKINVGGVSCDTVKVGTPFYLIAKVKTVVVHLINFKNQDKFRQRFVFGAIVYTESTSPQKTQYRYGWVDRRSIRAIPKTP